MPNISCLKSKINQELQKVFKWLRIDKLSLSISQSSYTVFKNCSQAVLLPQIAFDGISLKYLLCKKFLGVMVDA